jgi:phenylacetate-coenzyme A ligase PaaK-like adenylate-forming protein
LLFQIEQNQWRAPEEIESGQFEQVRQLVAFAAATVPHYRQPARRPFPGTRTEPAKLARIAAADTPDAAPVCGGCSQRECAEGTRRNFTISTSGSTGMIVEVGVPI